MSNTPSDAEIMDVARPFITRVGSHWENDDAIPDNGRIEEFARAVLAKWGAPQPVVREPLSANQVSELAKSAKYWHGDTSRADFINGIRYAEAAHGIKGGQHGAE